MSPPIRVLMVCTGNICRSPTAEGVLRRMAERAGVAHRIEVDSAGTTNYHVGDSPDRRSQMHAAQRGYDLSAQRARQVQAADFDAFDSRLQNGLLELFQFRPFAFGQQLHPAIRQITNLSGDIKTTGHRFCRVAKPDSLHPSGVEDMKSLALRARPQRGRGSGGAARGSGPPG